MTLSRSDKDATLDGPRLAIAGVKDVMMVVANAGVGSKSGSPTCHAGSFACTFCQTFEIGCDCVAILLSFLCI